MDYRKYKVEDFVLDQRFRKWVVNPDKDDNLYWEEWLEKNPRQVDKVLAARSMVLKLPKLTYKLNSKAKDDLWQTILKDSRKESQVNKRKPAIIPLYGSKSTEKTRKDASVNWRVAAVVAVLLGISFLLFDRISYTVNKQEPVEKIVKQNPLGQKSTIFLSEGSEVILNSGSKIIYHDSFGKDNRDIQLEGEAFFKVAENVDLPFRVMANGLVTTAVGTSFNVKSYKGGESTKVALVSGKVFVYNENKPEKINADTLMLVPGEQAVFYGKNKRLSKSTFDLKEETGWKDGIIFFKDDQAEDVFSYLEKWYGVKISEENTSTKKWNYSGEFQNMSLNGVLTSIGFTMGFEFNLKENEVFITYKN